MQNVNIYIQPNNSPDPQGKALRLHCTVDIIPLSAAPGLTSQTWTKLSKEEERSKGKAQEYIKRKNKL